MEARREDLGEFAELFDDTVVRFGDSLVCSRAAATTAPGSEGTTAVAVESYNRLVALISFGGGVLLWDLGLVGTSEKFFLC